MAETRRGSSTHDQGIDIGSIRGSQSDDALLPRGWMDRGRNATGEISSRQGGVSDGEGLSGDIRSTYGAEDEIVQSGDEDGEETEEAAPLHQLLHGNNFQLLHKQKRRASASPTPSKYDMKAESSLEGRRSSLNSPGFKGGFTIGNYTVIELIFESRRTCVYRAVRTETFDPNPAASSGSPLRSVSSATISPSPASRVIPTSSSLSLPLSPAASSSSRQQSEQPQQTRTKTYIIKTVKAEAPSVRDLALLRHEYRILKDLNVEGVIQAIALESFGHGLALILSDFEGESLAKVVAEPGKRLDLYEFLDIAIDLATVLGRVHAQGVIHQDIKPANITCNLATRKVQLIDFGISSRLNTENYANAGHMFSVKDSNKEANISRESSLSSDSDVGGKEAKPYSEFKKKKLASLVGTLAYMSPEQTGRMNRLVDYRSDYYSLGVTLFQLATGRLPFVASEPLEYVHCHMAMPPPRADEIDPRIPAPIGAIILKLMAKNAEDRYQSVEGLLADLHLCKGYLAAATKRSPRDDVLPSSADSAAAIAAKGGGQPMPRPRVTRKFSWALASFTAGELDRHSQFTIQQKLYGRETEVERLLSAYERVSHGQCVEAVFVRGYSGIGKSSIVVEVQKPIARQGGGLFISGKFDQFRRAASTLVYAFNDLIRHLLSEGREVVKRWRRVILEAVGSNGQLIIDLLPELEKVVGSQPSVPELGPSEAQNRFSRVFMQFVRVFCKPEHPLVLFLDDLQWADATSLKLLSLIMCDPDISYLLLIGAYRDNEVDPTHPLVSTIAELEKQKIPVVDIEVKSLSKGHVTRLVCDTLRCEMYEGEPLGALLHDKTGGNPFYVNQLLKSFYTEHHMQFDFQEGRWKWDLKSLQEAMRVTENVVDLMIRQIRKLDTGSQEMLKWAAALGDKFSLGTLAKVTQTSWNETAKRLWSPLQAGLILPLSQIYKVFVEEVPEAQSSKAAAELRETAELCGYKFLHDRVQQAAYLLIPEDEKKAAHLHIGRMLLANTPKDKIEDDVYHVVNHFNVGYTLLADEKEKQQVSMLNYTAGKKATAATAYLSAVKYLDLAVDLIISNEDRDELVNAGPSQDEVKGEEKGKAEASLDTRKEVPDCWSGDRYDTTFAIFIAATEAHFFNSDFKEAEHLCSVLLRHAKTAVEKVLVYEIQMQFHIQQHQMRPALDIGLAALKMLNIELAEERPEIMDKEFDSLPEMKDPAMLAGMRILMNLCAPTYVLEPVLNMRVGFTMVHLCNRHGTSALAAFGYGLYGLVCFLFDLDDGYRAGGVSLRLMEKYHAVQLIGKVYGLFYAHVAVWRVHLKETMSPLLQAVHGGLENGDLEFSGYSSFYYCDAMFFCGESMDVVAVSQEQFTNALLSRHQTLQATYLNIWRRLVIKLSKRSYPETYDFGGKMITDDQVLSELIELKNKMFLFTYYLANGMLMYLEGKYGEAVDLLNKSLENAGGVVGMMTNAQHRFYHSLSILAHAKHLDAGLSEEAKQQVRENQRALRNFARHAPINYKHKYLLVKAEFKFLRRKHLDAMDLYDSAIEGAVQHGFTHEEAIAKELAADFYTARKRERVAGDYRREAYYAYMRWGAVHKVAQLELKLPSLIHASTTTQPLIRKASINPASAGSSSSGSISSPSSSSSPSSTLSMGTLSTHGSTASSTNTTMTTTMPSSTESLDLSTVIKASQALLGEIDLEKLLGKLISSVMENTGAEKCTLLLERDGKLFLEALATVGLQAAESMSISINLHEPIENCRVLPLSLINYVSTTNEMVVLDELPTKGTFADDPYIRQSRPRSVMCTPILHLSKLLGILYLENKSMPAVFHKDRLWLVSIISSQMGISLNNSYLFSELSNKTQELQDTNAQLQSELEKKTKIQMDLERAMVLAKAAVISKNQFLANMSHEIRTPLNAILGMTGLLSDTPLNDQQTEWLQLVKVSGNTLLALIDDILDFAKMEHGTLRINKEVFALQECLTETLGIFLNEASLKHITLTLALNDSKSGDAECPPLIYTDPRRLRQILLNLLSNSLKFTPRNGTVTIQVNSKRVNVTRKPDSARAPSPRLSVDIGEGVSHSPNASPVLSLTNGPIELSEDKEEGAYDHLHFMVQDTGPGISKDLAVKLFQPFTQGDASFSRKTGGAGLGLAICKQLVELLGGEIWVESVEGQGACFHFTILCSHVRPGTVARRGSRSELALPAGRFNSLPSSTALARPPLPTASSSSTPSTSAQPEPPPTPPAPTDTRSALPAIVEPVPTSQPAVATPVASSEPPVTTAEATVPPKDPASSAPISALEQPSKQPVPIVQATTTEPVGQSQPTAQTQPQQTEAKSSSVALPASSSKPASLRILVAEDNPVNQKLLVHLLKRLSFNADMANDGVEAVDAWKKSKYDVILMDLQMPNMDGLTATRIIMESCVTAAGVPEGTPVSSVPHPQVIAVTANVYDSDKEACKQVGMCNFVGKPIKMDILKAALAQCHPIDYPQ